MEEEADEEQSALFSSSSSSPSPLAAGNGGGGDIEGGEEATASKNIACSTLPRDVEKVIYSFSSFFRFFQRDKDSP